VQFTANVFQPLYSDWFTKSLSAACCGVESALFADAAGAAGGLVGVVSFAAGRVGVADVEESRATVLGRSAVVSRFAATPRARPRPIVSDGWGGFVTGAFAGAGRAVATVGVSRLTLLVSRGVTVLATVPALESRVRVVAGARALAVSDIRAASVFSLPSLALHASAPSNTMPMYIL